MSLKRFAPRAWLIALLVSILTPAHLGVAAETAYIVSRFEVAWKRVGPDLPPLSDLRHADAILGRTARGFTEKARGKPTVRTDVAALNRQGVVRIDANALDALAAAIQRRLETAGLLGVTVQASIQQISEGRNPRYVAWFLVDVPLPGLSVNQSIPRELRGVHQAASAIAAADSTSAAKQPVRTATTKPSSKTKITAEPPVETPPAVETAVAASPPTETEATPAPEPPVETPPAVETIVAASPPVETEATPAPEPPVETPPVIEGVSVRWAEGAGERGDPATLFRLTTLRLRLVDGEMQAGWGDVGIMTSMYSDLFFPQEVWRRPWLPSATRAVRHAIEDRLKELGMGGTQVSRAFETEDGRSKLVFTLHPPARSADLPPLATQNETVDGNFYYAVWPFDVMYSLDHSKLPPASSFEHLPIELGRDEIGFTSVGEGDSIQATLGQLNDAGTMLYSPTALIAINRAIVVYLINQDLEGVFVLPWNKQIVSVGEEAGEDLRMGKTELTLLVTVGRVSEVQTSAWGDRIEEENRINNPAHESIAEGSPLSADGSEGDLLRYKNVEDYMYFLSRHPGRDVRLAASRATPDFVAEDITSGGPVGWETNTAPIDVEPPVAAEGDQQDIVAERFPDVTLDYQISEIRPWTVWYQWGNTGTKSEGYQRQQFGFYTSQLTGNDDIFTMQYATSDLRGSNAVVGRYEAPLGLDGRLRWGVDGSWSQYFADQFGGTLAMSNAFTGFSWSGGGELRLNVYQDGPFFIDAIGGGRLQHLGVENNLAVLPQQEMSFAIPYGMFQLEREGAWSSVRASIGMEGNVLSHGERSLQRMGAVNSRGDISNLWARLNWAGSLSTYLEPLFNYDAWNDLQTPASSTLAHEVYLGVSGQFAFDSRLLPQFQSVAGGPGTNRGYPVSIVAGDNALNLTGEYRFHVPRAFAPQDPPGSLFGEPFRYAPQRLHGRADWDLMLLGFVDYSWLTKNNKSMFESDHTLISAGVGMEFQFKRNVRVRLDWGWALRDLEGGLYDAGHNRLYVQASLSF
ncbi:MAG: hypothetical protein QF360_09660 [Phycisphaerales bacterium]|nr:hypothetical protein [Phycisphaerales bacterium]